MSNNAPEKRLAQFRELITSRDSSIKFYDLYVNRDQASDTTSQHAVDQIDTQIKNGTISRGTLGFAVCHQGRDANWLIRGLWQDGGIIQFKTFASTLERPEDFSPVDGDFIICVWELGVVDFERQVWRQHMLNESSNVHAYLSTTLTGWV